MTTDSWTINKEVYAPAEVEAVLRALGVSVVDETDRDWLCLCPYHGNTDSPAFSVSKTYGYGICFNPACAVGSEERLTIEKMVTELKGGTRMEAKRFIMQHKGDAGLSFDEKFDLFNKDVEEELPEFPQSAIDKMHERLGKTPAAIEYMKGRGFTVETLKEFKVGFAPAATGYNVPVYREFDMVMVPAYDHKSKPVGLIGRAITEKVFKNYGPLEKGRGLKKSHIIWNLNNARKYETLILCESTFDAMRIHQAGYPNVAALLGGSLSQIQIDLINRHFSKVMIFTDNENDTNGAVDYPRHCRKCLNLGFKMCQGHKAGRELGMKIAQSLPRQKIMWAVYDDKHIYARDVKDASDMTDEEIVVCLRNAIDHYEYLDWVS